MSTHDAAVPLDELLAHRAWVRALAVALSRDENDADDLEQQTWLTAMRNPPRDRTSPRGWLGAVTRSMARRRARTQARRDRREGRAARSDVVHDDPARLAARAEVHARIATAVVGLREPYRQTVLLHYFEGLSVRETAARMGAPFETTRARLRRGREQLRRRLGDESGAAEPLAVLLLPLLPHDAGSWGSTGTAAATAGGAVVMSKIVMGSVAACALAACVLWVTWGDGEEPVAAMPVETAPDPEPEENPDAAPTRERVHVAATALTPATDAETEDDTDAVPEDAAPPSTVEERLQRKLDDVNYQDASLHDVLARISAQTDVPVHVQAELVPRMGSDEFQINLRLDRETAARDVLKLLSVFRGLTACVEDGRVVIHDAELEWKDGMSTVVIPPKLPDPNAPTTLTVRGRVVDETGGGIEGAVIRHAATEVARSGPGGHFEVELTKQFQFLTARAPDRQRSGRFAVKGEYGDTLDAELVVGGPAGSVRVEVASSSGQDPERCRIHLSWSVPGTESTLPDGRRVAKRDRESRLLGPQSGGFSADVGSLPPGEVRVVTTARDHVKDDRVVTVEAGERTDIRVTLRKADLAERVRTERITARFEDARLRDVTNYIRDSKALNIIIDPALAAAASDPRVTLSAQDITLESALDEICTALTGAKWEVRDQVVFITRSE